MKLMKTRPATGNRSNVVLPGVAGLALGLVGVGTTIATAKSEPTAVRCEIQVKSSAGGVTIEGVAIAKTAIDGSYRLVITKSGGGGSSNINQGGEFSSAGGNRTSLGTVVLGGDGGSYTAKLTVLWDGHSAQCSEKVRGSL